MTTTIIIAVSDPMTLLFLLLNMKDILVLQIYPPFLKQRTISVFGLQLLRFYEFSFLTSFSNPYHRLLCHSLHRSVILFIFLSMENIQSSKRHSHKQLFTIHHWLFALYNRRLPQLNIRMVHISWYSTTYII